MPLIRPHTIAPRHLALTPLAARRTLTSTPARSASDSHASESHYDPPGGWLWGIPPNEKPKREEWETVWYWGFFGSLILGGIAYAYKPDTRYVYSGNGYICGKRDGIEWSGGRRVDEMGREGVYPCCICMGGVA